MANAPKKTKIPLTAEQKAAKAEEKKAKFKGLANARINKALRALDILTNLAKPSYGVTPEAAAKIESALTAKVAAVTKAFNAAAAGKAGASGNAVEIL